MTVAHPSIGEESFINTFYVKILEALAVGDAMGMPTEFLKREDIKTKFGLVSEILDPSVSWLHANLAKAAVTDDTEQNLYLIEAYCQDAAITIDNTSKHLLRWIRESKADEKGYIGPSSLKALTAIADGEDPRKAGTKGTTCGGVMRTLSAVLCCPYTNEQTLQKAVFDCCIPTHNTAFAVEAAMSYAYALRSALLRETYADIIQASIKGAAIGRALPETSFPGPSTSSRIEWLARVIHDCASTDEVLDLIYHVIGTGLESYEVGPAVIGIFMWAKEDVWLAIRMGASIGGDSDTIAALAGALSAAYNGSHNIPAHIGEEVLRANELHLQRYADLIKERQDSIADLSR